MSAAPPMTCDQVNAMTQDAFVAAFGDVAEHSPWVAEAVAEGRPYAGREALIAAFQSAIGAAPRDRRLALLCAHPDLAGKAALAGAARFGFPFILAVKGATKHDILEAFDRRLENDPEEEFRTALEQVQRIVRLRLEDRVRP
jgi:2-oxo-4-hydroxy-4-carboxy-5-ureidoimidazoline decarboxylase